MAESISHLNSVKEKNALGIFMHSSLLVFGPQKYLVRSIWSSFRRPKSVLKELPVIGGRFQNSNCCDGGNTGFCRCKRLKGRLPGGGIAHAES